MYRAVDNGHLEIVKFLIKAGADVDICDRHNVSHSLAELMMIDNYDDDVSLFIFNLFDELFILNLFDEFFITLVL